MKSGESAIKIWGAQIRANFLILSVLLVAIGLSLSAWHTKITGIGSFNYIHALMLIIGVVLSHCAVNLFNEYSDHKTGIDMNTARTPFSGGSGMMQSGLTKPGAVLAAAVSALTGAFLIGVYFCIKSHWFLMIIIAIGGIAIVSYTGFLARILMGELFAGLTLGSFVVLGTFISMTGNWQMTVKELLPLNVILICIPPGILTFLLLLLNEFPDSDADRTGGRFHLVIWLGKKRAAIIYIIGLIIIYSFIIVLPVMQMVPFWVLISLASIPLAVKSGSIALKHGEDTEKLIPALGMNVGIVLLTDALLAVSFYIALFF